MSIGLCRLGSYGDALWLSSVLPALKDQHGAVTVYTSRRGEKMLRHDPHIDAIVVAPDTLTHLREQVEYAQEQAKHHDHFVNLTGSVETRLLPLPFDLAFYLEHDVRCRVLNGNYLEMIHTYCGVDGPPRVRFHPSADEARMAMHRRPIGFVVVIQPDGSGFYKRWPHWPLVAHELAERGAHVFVVGEFDPPTATGLHRNVRVIGQQWPIRDVLSLSMLADCVIGVESVLVNAVSFEPMRKVVLLSHSSENNLTRDWVNTVAIGADVECRPCHRIHYEASTCNVEGGRAACMRLVPTQEVIEAVGVIAT